MILTDEVFAAGRSKSHGPRRRFGASAGRFGKA
jgi:hypothetical protein